MSKIRPGLDIRWRLDGQVAGPNEVAIVADVLRGSTTIVTAMSLRAEAVLVTRGVDRARYMAKVHHALLIGERKNVRLDGFDFGNSPVDLVHASDRIRGATIVFSSTNFPLAVQAAGKAQEVLIGALVNLAAVCSEALDRATALRADVAILLAGEPSQSHAKEDYYFAGCAAKILADFCVLSTEAKRAAAFAKRHSPSRAIRVSIHAQELIRNGFHEDVTFAFQLDRFDTVPQLRDGWIVAER